MGRVHHYLIAGYLALVATATVAQEAHVVPYTGAIPPTVRLRRGVAFPAPPAI